jgi:uncharacterized protein YlxW (UPF0749 family)
MSYASLPTHWVNAAVVFVQERLVSRYAEQSQQNREAIYRDARRVKQQLEESESQQTQLRIQVETLRAEIDQLRRQAESNPFEDPDQVARYAAQAQAEGVSLPVAQRLLKTLQASGPPRSRRSAASLKKRNARRRRF